MLLSAVLALAQLQAAAGKKTYSLLDAPTMPGAFFGVSMNFSAWSGGFPEYFAIAGISPVTCAALLSPPWLQPSLISTYR